MGLNLLGDDPDASRNIVKQFQSLGAKSTRGLDCNGDEVMAPSYGEILVPLLCLRQLRNCPCLASGLDYIGSSISVRAGGIPDKWATRLPGSDGGVKLFLKIIIIFKKVRIIFINNIIHRMY